MNRPRRSPASIQAGMLGNQEIGIPRPGGPGDRGGRFIPSMPLERTEDLEPAAEKVDQGQAGQDPQVAKIVDQVKAALAPQLAQIRTLTRHLQQHPPRRRRQ